jgi:enoyl-CoA hydratase/carnithine racemase
VLLNGFTLIALSRGEELMSYSSFVLENQDGIVTIRLNDPERLNALTFQTYADLENVSSNWLMTVELRWLS